MREVVTINEDLVRQAWQVIQVENFNDLVTLAIKELVKSSQTSPRLQLMDLYGQGGIQADYDHKRLRIEE